MATPPVGLPFVADQLHATLQTLAEMGQILLRQGRPLAKRIITTILQSGLATSEAVLRASRQAALATRLGWAAATTYGPSIAVDMTGYAARAARRLAGRRARSAYLLAAGLGVATIIVICGATAVSTIRSYASDISSPAALLAKKKTGITITDRNGAVLFEGYGASSPTLVHLGDLPKNLKNATLAAEDPSFYDHTGFSWKSTTRAAITDITHQSRAEGGSTLTQQLVKNALLTSQKKFQRKYQEILLAIELERHYSKDEIFEMYLNETYYGQGSSGVEAASLTYFHKSAKDLTLSESALLAGLPLGPSRFDPNVSLPDAVGRRNYVLSRMLEFGKITPTAAEAAKAEPISLADNPTASGIHIYAKTITIRAPHFVFYVLDQIRAIYGQDEGENLIENGGIKVQTTLELTKQELAEQSVSMHISQLASHHVTNGGLISLEPKTGDILAMVGSVDYNAPGFGNVNVTLSQLQPGSSFKPIAYATAFKKGWTGATVIDDAPFSAPSGDGTLYTPQNYDGRFHGKVTVRHALDNSLNIPAVKTLQFGGIHDTIQTAHDLGITSLNDESRYGLALVLGGGEVRPIDMATAYATFDNNGTKIEPRAILRIYDRYGKEIAKPAVSKPASALDPRIAYMITNILSDDSSRQPEFPANGPLHLSRPAAAKTGTTNDFRDNWTVGYTPSLVTAVWVGNNDHTPMENVDGITGAAPIWHDYMEQALADTPAENFVTPAGITLARVCPSDGGLANPWDSGYSEVFMTDAMPTKHCSTSAPKPNTIDPNNPNPPAFPNITIPPITFPKINPLFQPFN